MAETHHLVIIGGEEYRFRLEVVPLLEAKKVTGQSAGQLLGGVVSIDIEAMVTLIWAGLRPTRHKFSLQDARELMQKWINEGSDLEEIGAAILQTARVSGMLSEKVQQATQGEEGGEGEDPKAG